MSYNIDMCDFILFMNKLHPVPNIDIKKVNVDASYLETTTNTLVFSYSDAGIMESLLGEFIVRIFSIFSDKQFIFPFNSFGLLARHVLRQPGKTSCHKLEKLSRSNFPLPGT